MQGCRRGARAWMKAAVKVEARDGLQSSVMGKPSKEL
jgi:hypothetical protein